MIYGANCLVSQRSTRTVDARAILAKDDKLTKLIANRTNLLDRVQYWNAKPKQIKEEIADLKRMMRGLEKDLPKAQAKAVGTQAKLNDAKWAVKERRRLVIRTAYAKMHQAVRKRLGLTNLQSINQMITEMEKEDNESNGLIQDNPGDTSTEV